MPLDPKWCIPEVYWAKTLRLGAKMSSYTPHLCIWGCCTGAPTPARAGSASRWAFFRVWPHGGHATGALYVPQARHSVASPFVATYRRLVPYLLGPPVTEAYREAEVLTQDFDHLRLEWRQGRVVVGDLGAAIYPYELGDGMSRVPARPNTPTQRYFPQTGQLLQGDFLHFWQTRGGLATFGAPISGIQHEGNGDGSGLVYAVQWFQKARLERHPETHTPRFAILLGLLGRESVDVRGWLPPRHHRGRYEEGIFW